MRTQQEPPIAHLNRVGKQVAMFTPLTQFSVFLTNKPGILSKVCDALADQRINLIAVTLMDSIEHGVFRLVVGSPDRARDVLKGINISFTETEVLCAELSNRPGALADICAKLNAEHISIKYAYVTSGASGGRTTAVFKVDNTQKALRMTVGNKKKAVRKDPRALVQRNRAITSR